MYYQPVKGIASLALSQSVKRSISVVVATLAIFGYVATGYAGGFQLSVESASATSTHKTKDAVLFVQTFGCHTPADAAVTATAEGVVNGERRSLPLELVYDSTGVYALKQQWPSEGSWVLAITGEYNGITSTLIVDLGPNGKVHPGTRMVPGERKGVHARLMQRKPTPAEIDSALKAVTGNVSQLPSDDSSEKATSQRAAWVVGGLGAFFFLAGFAALTRRARPGLAAARRDSKANEDMPV
jgi:hypothetical protein